MGKGSRDASAPAGADRTPATVVHETWCTPRLAGLSSVFGLHEKRKDRGTIQPAAGEDWIMDIPDLSKEMLRYFRV